MCAPRLSEFFRQIRKSKRRLACHRRDDCHLSTGTHELTDVTIGVKQAKPGLSDDSPRAKTLTTPDGTPNDGAAPTTDASTPGPDYRTFKVV